MKHSLLWASVGLLSAALSVGCSGAVHDQQIKKEGTNVTIVKNPDTHRVRVTKQTDGSIRIEAVHD